jgi:hypothetical protein
MRRLGVSALSGWRTLRAFARLLRRMEDSEIFRDSVHDLAPEERPPRPIV